MPSRQLASALVTASLLLGPSSARADWPMQRHDAARTGTASGTGNLTAPAPYFRHYLGGSLFDSHMVTFDVDMDGAEDVIMITGGRAVARTVGDDDLWSSPPRGFSRMPGLADLNGDGSPELVVATSSQVFALDPRTGAELWREPPGEMGTVGGVRLADFDDDGATDLLIAECGCCGVNSGYPGAVYTFADGFAAARHLFELPSVYCGFSRAITVVNIDGAGPPELLLPESDRMRVWDPSTGTMVAESAAIGSHAFWHHCWPAQLDADPGQEVACVLMENNSAVVDRWRITVLDYDDSTTGALTVLWSEVLAPDDTGDVRVLDPVVDLDEDGRVEMVVSVATSGAWETRIYDAASGARMDTIPDAIAAGHIPTAAGRQLVTRSTGALSGWRYVPGSATPTWSLPGHDPFTGWSFAQAALVSVPRHLVQRPTRAKASARVTGPLGRRRSSDAARSFVDASSSPRRDQSPMA